ncbi:MAG: SpvB/TcaC N-terminal domain-containing protein, partial [Salibacteraceae bacterium]
MSNKSGIGSNIISLPKGGGAQGGLGESFSPDLFTGTGNYSVPVGVPAGRNGFQPQLSLGYSTGNGNSPFGLGWGLSVPGVSRKTNRGIPVYDDDQDVFVLSGAEDLVLLEKERAVVEEVVHQQWRYRPRTEGLFARITHHKFSDGRDYWEVRSKDGLCSYYGSPDTIGAEFQLSNPAVDDNIFAWKLCRTEDLFGNRIEYAYERVVINEAEHHAAQHYLQSIRYVNYPDGDGEAFLCSVQLHYAERPDPYSTGRSGFEVRTTRRCTAITTHTHPKDADLPAGHSPTAGGNSLLYKRYDLRYQDELGAAPLNGVSLLAELLISSTDAASGETEILPPLSFGYTDFDPEQRDLFPLQGKALPGQSLGAAELELADLDGNGLPDFVEVSTQGIRYWKNLGEGRFSVPKTMRSAPNFSLADPEVQLMDANGDGRIDLMVSKPGVNGYFSLDHQGNWNRNAMKRYRTAPSFSFADPEVKMLDLDGDGITDVLRSGSRFEHYFQSAPVPDQPMVAGWDRINTTNRRQLNSFPNVNYSNPQIKLADMSGDGLQDIVQVQNGSIWYWPNLGHGQWGKRRTMKGSGLRFPSGWDPQRELLGDVVGDGPADLMYLEDGKVHLWINQSGNRWGEKITVKGTPRVYNADGVRLVDLLGTGVSGLLWTYDAGTGGFNNSFFLDFTARVKPYVMTSMNNNKGAITQVRYESSVVSWMRDQADPQRRWKTTLPFPVQVIAQTEVIDEISGGKLVTRFQYSHGYWDGHEREFRGFARVEQFDTESFERYNLNAANAFQKVQLQHYAPPSKTVNWFHLGGITSANAAKAKDLFYELDLRHEYWSGDPQLLERSAEVTNTLAALPQLHRRDAFRALRGSVLRTETYAADQNGSFDSALAQKPITVSEGQFGVRQESAGVATTQAIFFTYSEGSRTTNWERGQEPKTSFSFTADYDAYGQAGKTISIAVPRGINPLNGFGLPGAPHLQDGPFLCTAGETHYLYADTASQYLCDRVSEQKSFEVSYTGRQSVFALRDAILAGTVSQKILSHSLMYYDGSAFTGLPHGTLGAYGVVSRSETLYTTLPDLDAAWSKRPELFTTNGTPDWSNHPETFAEEWPNDRAGYTYQNAAPYVSGFYFTNQQNQYDFQAGSGSFGLITAMRDAFDQETQVSFDAYQVLPISVSDAKGMTTLAEMDYRVLQPREVTDPNNNVSAARFSPLGLPIATALMGKAGENEGDTLNDPGTLLEYDLNAWYTQRQPAWVKTTVREHHVHSPDDDDATQVSVEYTDGFGRLLQTRKQAEDTLYTSKAVADTTLGDAGLPANQEAANGPAIGWRKAAGAPDHVLVSGHKVYNNKGKVVEQYEPYFAKGYAYQALQVDYPHREALDMGQAV